MDLQAAEALLKSEEQEALAFRLVTEPTERRTPLTYLGGRPTLSPELTWPRGDRGQPMTFLGQIDLSTLPSFGGRQMLPGVGILHFFEYTGNQDTTKGSVLFSKVKTQTERATPSDAPPYGDHNAKYRHAWLREAEIVDQNAPYPVSYPKWHVEPLKLKTIPWWRAYDAPWYSSANLMKTPGMGELTTRLREERAKSAFGRDPSEWPDWGFDSPLERPHPSFPFAWCFVAGWVGDYIKKSKTKSSAPKFLLGASDVDGARNWLGRAKSAGLLTSVPSLVADEFWNWVVATATAWAQPPDPKLVEGSGWTVGARNPGALNFHAIAAINFGCDLCLSNDGRAASLIPPEFLERLRHRYWILNSVAAGAQDQLLGYPSNLGTISPASDDVMLMQFRSSPIVGCKFGDGDQLQFWIKKDALKAGKFGEAWTVTHSS